MRRVWVWVLGLVVLSGGVMAEDTSKDLGLQFSRYDQMIDRLTRQNEQLMGEIRQVERDNLMMKKSVEDAQNRAQLVSDQFQQLQNMTVNGLVTGQKQLAEKVNDLTSTHGAPWGDGTRDCQQLGVKHQQIKVQVSPDGAKSVKFLCYDGKVLHLGTEVHDLGE